MARTPNQTGETDAIESSTRRRSIRDVADLAGVSVGTVSNVLNKPSLVAEPTRQRVESAITELGFIRNASARQLRAGTSRTVGAVVLNIANPFFTDVARGMEDRLAEEDCVLMLASSDENRDREHRYLRLLEEQGARGILLTPTESDVSWLEGTRQRGAPVVLVDRTSPSRDMCSVALDDVKGGELVGAHLVGLGHTRIAFVNGSTKIRQCADRRKGIRKAIRRAGLTTSDALIEITVSSHNANAGEDAVERILALPQEVTAIACVNDLTALGVVRGLIKKKIAVPEEMAVVGYDDVEFASVLSTPLTSIRQPRYEIGHTAADLLLAEARDDPEHRHRQVLFQPELVVRASSQPDGAARGTTTSLGTEPNS